MACHSIVGISMTWYGTALPGRNMVEVWHGMVGVWYGMVGIWFGIAW